jgi:hypothetical protein
MNSALSGDWIRIPARQGVRAIVEVLLQPLGDENKLPKPKPLNYRRKIKNLTIMALKIPNL